MFTLEDILPLSLVRQHTKTDDTPAVTDELLEFYRQSAFDTAEQYTGRVWTRRENVIQDVPPDMRKSRVRSETRTIRLKSPATDGRVTFYGGSLSHPYEAFTEPGSYRVRIPNFAEPFMINDCCAPTACNQYGLKASYTTGVANPKDVPAGILLGVLRFIAWNITNAGDITLTVQGKQGFSGAIVQGTNNGAWASGAIEQWRMFR